jgi:hypothetical protein
MISLLDNLLRRLAQDLIKATARVDVLDSWIADQSARLEALSVRIEGLMGREQTAIDARRQQIDMASTRIGPRVASASDSRTTSSRLDRFGEPNEVSLAPSAGLPAGTALDAREALAHHPGVKKAAGSAVQSAEINTLLAGQSMDHLRALVDTRCLLARLAV